MARYIDVNKKIEEINMRIESTIRLIENRPYDEEANLILREHKFCLRELECTSTADVVEVVRCKDCKCSKEQDKVFGITDYKCSKHNISCLSPYDFCSYGERK